MLEKRIGASELARAVGVTPTAVWNWQQNDIIPRPHTLSAIAGVLSVTERYLRSGEVEDVEEAVPDIPASAGSETVAEMMDNLRVRIARATGFEVDRIKLNLEFVSD
ncbi:helix-turn-helix domain-containing protein [Oleomonas cavernae]|uniref:helix-turn-helix domain-containing protein n=1 Tax=Oleomonas cavernae TaxID=2320859 RepID=UPI0013140D1F|nr:helix-turn-helix transcriptional regulator [Oleomonas cavernae]